MNRHHKFKRLFLPLAWPKKTKKWCLLTMKRTPRIEGGQLNQAARCPLTLRETITRDDQAYKFKKLLKKSLTETHSLRQISCSDSSSLISPWKLLITKTISNSFHQVAGMLLLPINPIEGWTHWKSLCKSSKILVNNKSNLTSSIQPMHPIIKR